MVISEKNNYIYSSLSIQIFNDHNDQNKVGSGGRKEICIQKNITTRPKVISRSAVRHPTSQGKKILGIYVELNICTEVFIS